MAPETPAFWSCMDLLHTAPEISQEKLGKSHRCVENLAISTISTFISEDGLLDMSSHLQHPSPKCQAQGDSSPECDNCEQKASIKQ